MVVVLASSFLEAAAAIVLAALSTRVGLDDDVAEGMSSALLGLMAFSSPNSSVAQIGALVVHVAGNELGI